MLYIGGYSGESSYVVVDSDDNVEQIITLEELRECILKYGLQIEGVDYSFAKRKGERKVVIHGVRVYKEAVKTTMKAVKMQLLYGISMVVRGETIMSIEIPQTIPKFVKIRLSDYGTICHDQLIQRPVQWGRDGIYVDVELILDDKIKQISPHTFNRIFTTCVSLNLKEFSSDCLVPCILEEFARGSNAISKIDKYVIDRPDRMAYYKAKAVIEYYIPAKHIPPEIANAHDCVLAEYYDDFKSLTSIKFRALKSASFERGYSSLAKWLMSKPAESLLSKRNYKAIKASRYKEILGASSHSMGFETHYIVEKFWRYIDAFDATPEMQEVFIDFCTNWRDWLKSWTKRNRLILC